MKVECPSPTTHHLSKSWRVNENSHPQRKIFILLMAQTKCHLCCDNERSKVHYCRSSIHLWSGSQVIWCNSPCNPLNGKKLGSKCQMDTHNIISGKTSICVHPLALPSKTSPNVTEIERNSSHFSLLWRSAWLGKLFLLYNSPNCRKQLDFWTKTNVAFKGKRGWDGVAAVIREFFTLSTSLWT